MKKTIRTDSLKGVKVKVVSRPKSFDVFITIEPGTYLWQERRSENCRIRFSTHYENRVEFDTVKFKLTNQAYDKTQLLKYVQKTFAMREGGQCTIVLFPTFFLPPDLAEESRRQREWRDTYGKNNPGICTRVGGSPKKGKSKTIYKRNNAGRPYQGGSVRPK